jgi:hypothetical protein
LRRSCSEIEQIASRSAQRFAPLQSSPSPCLSQPRQKTGTQYRRQRRFAGAELPFIAAGAAFLLAATAFAQDVLKTIVDGAFAPHAMPKLSGGMATSALADRARTATALRPFTSEDQLLLP